METSKSNLSTAHQTTSFEVFIYIILFLLDFRILDNLYKMIPTKSLCFWKEKLYDVDRVIETIRIMH